ncbi:unnamed protein product [Knipowitschia caucasica]
MQSGGLLELQQQVESLLGTLVKAAAVELTKLFESTYLSTAANTGRRDLSSGSVKACNPLKVSEGKQSVGVQVNVVDCTSTARPDPFLCLDDSGFKVDGLTPSGFLLTEEDEAPIDPLWSAVNTLQDGVDPGDLLQSLLEIDTIPPSQSQGESYMKNEHSEEHNVSTDKHLESPQRPSTKKKKYVIQPSVSDGTMNQTKFVCPIILKTQSPKAEVQSPEQSSQAEPQQGNVSTAKGKAYSPSVFDGTITPAHAGVSQKNQHVIKMNSLDLKLLTPCAVPLVDVLSVPLDFPKDAVMNVKPGWSVHKDLRPHQSLHTGHRLCCFTKCNNGVWRLQKIAMHSRSGYVCSKCEKIFKHRKILRRHERFHTGERPYECTFSNCFKTFALRKSLRRHLRFHTGERPHSCTHCGKCFRLRENLKAHLRFHSGEKPYNCSACGKTFRIQKNLEKHSLSQCGVFVPSFRTIAGL